MVLIIGHHKDIYFMECHSGRFFFFMAQLLQVVEMDLLHDLALSGASGLVVPLFKPL